MKKNLLIIFLLTFFAIEGFAKTRTESEALSIASKFYENKPGLRTAGDSKDLSLAFACKDEVQTRSSSEVSYYYVFNAGEDSYVIISGDDRAKDILGYSDNGNFDINTVPENLKNWLSFYQSELKQLTETSEGYSENSPIALQPEIRSFATTISPLLGGIKWNQGDPYNALCPVIAGGTYAGERTVTGCVATAMAQIMKYHNWPEQGIGSNSYTTSTLGLNLSADFENTTYEWSKMTDTYNGNSTEEAKNAVATLMYHCGVSVNMDYYVSSGAVTRLVATVLSQNFKYDETTQSIAREYYQTKDWITLIKSELNSARPIIYSGRSSGGGHAFICDGYDSNGLFHFNWGWGGLSDGYFELSALNPNSLGIGGGSGGYNTSQAIITGIQKPNTQEITPPTLFIAQETFTIAASSISRNGYFSASILSAFNMGVRPISIKIGLGLYDTNNNFIRKINETGFINLDSYRGYNNYPFNNLSIPGDIETGNYKIYPILTTNGTDWEPIRTTVGLPQCISAVITPTNIIFLPSTEGLSSISVVANSLKPIGNVYTNRDGMFTVDITNYGSGDYSSNLILKLISDNNSSTSQIIANDPVVIAAGETKTITFSGTVGLSPGNYTIDILYDPYNNRNYFTEASAVSLATSSIIIKEEPAAAELAVSDYLSMPNSSAIYNNDKVTIFAKIKNTGGIFNGKLNVFVYNLGGGSSIASLDAQNVILETNEEKIIEFEGNLALDPNTYYARVFVLVGNTYTRLNPTNYNRVEFTIIEGTAVGLEQNQSGEKLHLYPNPAVDEIYFDSDETVNQIQITDISGKVILVKYPQTDGKLNVPVSNLSKGAYIMRIVTDNEISTHKFIKK